MKIFPNVKKYIKDQSGKAFDPRIVNIFEQVTDQLKEINENNKDE